MAIQNFLIAHILNPLSRLTVRWSDKQRTCVFICGGLPIFAQYFLHSLGIGGYRYLIFFGIDCLFLGLMVLCTLPENLQPIRFQKFGAICWVAVGFFMMISGILVTENRLPEAMLFLLVYPVVFLAWNNVDHGKVFHRLSYTCIVTFIPYTVINILFFPMGENQYMGLMHNPNDAARYLLLVFVCLMAELLPVHNIDIKYVVNLVLLGLCAAQLYYSSSRTCYLAALTTGMITIPVYLLTHRKSKKAPLYRNILLGCVSIVLCVNTALYLFQISKLFTTGAQPSSSASVYEQEDPAHSQDQTTYDLNGITEFNDQKMSVAGKTLDKISSGRISIWKAFGENLNLLGHEDGISYHIAYNDRSYDSAHNTILQIAHETGIPSAIFYLLYNLFSGVAAIWYAIRHKDEAYALFPLAVVASFGFTSVFESLVMSFYHMQTFYYYLVQFPLIAYVVKEQNSQQNRCVRATSAGI